MRWRHKGALMARMTKVEKYAAIRRDSRMEGLSQRGDGEPGNTQSGAGTH